MHLPDPAADPGEPSAPDPEARVAKKRRRPSSADLPWPSRAWERECRPFFPSVASLLNPDPPALV